MIPAFLESATHMDPNTGTSLAPGAFALTKWYLDCLSSDGRVAIGYWVKLRWRGMSLRWHALTLWENGQRTVERSSLSPSPMPSRTSEEICWNASALGCRVVAEGCRSAGVLRLFQTATGSVDWRCEAPMARLAIDVTGATPIHGMGYVERLDLTIPPWHLPIRELRWGRWIAADASHSIVWIDWRGEQPRSWALVDGVPACAPGVQDERVDLSTSALTLACDHTLASRALADILGPVPVLRAVLPRSVLALREVKWVSRGTWHRVGEGDTPGHALHERVVFR